MTDLSKIPTEELLRMLQGGPPQQQTPQAPQEPSTADTLRASPLGGAVQTLIRGGQGLIESAAGLPSPFSAIDPEMGREKEAVFNRLSSAFRGQRGEYQQNKMNVAEASGDPRLFLAMTGTAEDAAQTINPAGAVGAGITNPILRGMAGASGFALSQPVDNPDANFWVEKAKQQAMAVPVGGVMGALSAPPKAKAPTMDELRNIKTAQYKAVEDVPVPVTKEMRSAIHDQYGRDAVLKAVKDAEIRQDYSLANEMRSLLDPDTRPSTVSAEAADKISRSFRELGSAAMATPGEKTAGSGWLSRRGKVETALEDVPDLKIARRVNTQLEKATKVEAAISLAQDRNTTPGGAADLNQALRREFGKLVGDRDYMGSLTQPERDAIKAVANGTFTANMLQRIGKWSPIKNHLSAVVDVAALGGGMHLSGGDFIGAAPALGLAMVGEGARQGGIAATSRNAALASELMRRNALPSAPGPSGVLPGPAPNVPVGNLPSALLIEALMRPQRAY